MGGDFSFASVESDDHFLARDGSSKSAEEAQIEFSFSECSGADDDLRGAEFC